MFDDENEDENLPQQAKQADAIYQRKYVPLTEEYLSKISEFANLDDVLNGKCTLEHADSITNYSGNLSSVLNNAIRCKYLDLTEDLSKFEKNLAKALSTLPAYNSQIVFRMEKRGPEPAYYKKYFESQIGKVLNVPCYLSTSLQDWNCTKVVYRIKTLCDDSHARDISRITNRASEQEVLFCKNTNLLIKAVTPSDEKLIIDMEESKSAAHATLNYYNCELEQ